MNFLYDKDHLVITRLQLEIILEELERNIRKAVSEEIDKRAANIQETPATCNVKDINKWVPSLKPQTVRNWSGLGLRFPWLRKEGRYLVVDIAKCREWRKWNPKVNHEEWLPDPNEARTEGSKKAMARKANK